MTSAEMTAQSRATTSETPAPADAPRRALNVAVAAVSLVVAAPVMLAIAAAVKLTSPGPALYQQVRVGLDVRLSILEFLHRSLGEAYRPNTILIQHVKAGRLGRKTGRGVYSY